MESIGFNYNNKNYTCQSEGPGVWSCGESENPANIQLTCSESGQNKITCTLPNSSTTLTCDTVSDPFGCTLQNEIKKNEKVKNYEQKSYSTLDYAVWILDILLIFWIFFIFIYVAKYDPSQINLITVLIGTIFIFIILYYNNF